MTATVTPAINPALSIRTDRPQARRPLSLLGLAAGASAAAATMLVAAAARGLDVSLKLTGSGGHPAKAIPLGGFGSLTVGGAVAGILLAVASRRWARRPATRFVTLAVFLTVVSLVPDVISAADTGTMLVLWLTHVVAAAIIVPPLAARLRQGSGR